MIFHVLNASLLNLGVGGSDVEWFWRDYSSDFFSESEKYLLP